ncbi:unnamed protein product [Tenebrio molitor]|nr:unnamed protein product [Tenebrio molitor]
MYKIYKNTAVIITDASPADKSRMNIFHEIKKLIKFGVT